MEPTDFQDEEPTKPEETEALVDTLERLRKEPDSKRPSVRMKALTQSPPPEQS